MKWFRFYAEALNDRKVQSLPGDMFKAWVNILCLYCNEGAALDLSSISFALRAGDSKAEAIVDDLLNRGLLDDTAAGLVPHNWNNRQYKSDVSGSRVARYRETRRKSGLKVLSDYNRFRSSLIRRDGERCVYCSATAQLVVDHMVPVKLGGTDDLDNLALSCRACNSGKAGRTPELAGMKIVVTTAENALAKYRDRQKHVTVTVTPPDTDTDSEPNGSDASASGREALWGNGVTTLIALGVSETRAKPMIGRWLKDAGDDFERVLGAISRARSEAPIDPIAWITAALKAEGGKNGKPENLSAVARRLAEQGISFGPKPSLAGAGGEADSPPVRLLSKG
jgi:5-methylcytosine-specific restriction endonuclease McrA